MPKKQTRKTQPFPVQWEELTDSDFPEAIRRAQGVCVLPIGVIEKHAPHLPLGTDVMAVREASVQAAQRLQDEFHGRAQGPLASKAPRKRG